MGWHLTQNAHPVNIMHWTTDKPKEKGFYWATNGEGYDCIISFNPETPHLNADYLIGKYGEYSSEPIQRPTRKEEEPKNLEQMELFP